MTYGVLHVVTLLYSMNTLDDGTTIRREIRGSRARALNRV